MWENFFEVVWWVIWPWSIWGLVIWFGYTEARYASSRLARIEELEKSLEETAAKLKKQERWHDECAKSWREDEKELRELIRKLRHENERDGEEARQKIEAAKRVSIDSILGLRPEKKAKSRGA